MTPNVAPGVAWSDLPLELQRIPDGLNAAILAGQLLGFAGLLALAQAVPAWAVPLVGVAFAVWMSAVYAAIHEAQHGVLFSNPRANTLGGVALATLLPAPYHLIRQTHAGHHLRNRSDDEAFDLWMPGESPAWKRVQWYGILSGAFFTVVVLSNLIVVCLPWLMRPSTYRFDRPSRAALSSLNPEHRLVMAVEGAANLALHAVILLGTGLPLRRYAVLYACHGVLWSALQYVWFVPENVRGQSESGGGGWQGGRCKGAVAP